MHKVLVNRLGGLSLPRKCVVRLTDRPDMTLDVYRGRKTTKQQNNNNQGFSQKGSLGESFRMSSYSQSFIKLCQCEEDYSYLKELTLTL